MSAGGRRRLELGALLCAVLATVGWVRTRPLVLAGAERLAEPLVRDRLERHHAAELPPGNAPDETARELERRVDAWIRAHPDRWQASIEAVAARLREELGEDPPAGRPRPYLGDVDAYAWLRQARSYLRAGTVCDAIVDGVCRDELTLAPVGSRMPYPRSLHVAAIVGMHRLLAALGPEPSISWSAMLVPVAVGTLLAVPLFLLGVRFGGAAGGVVAALAGALQPQLLLRSIGSDNDVWNAALPVLAIGAAIAALDAGRRRGRISLGAASGVLTGLHAVTWSGWIANEGLLLGGLAVGFVIDALRRLRGRADPAGTGRVPVVTAAHLAALVATVAIVGAPIPSLPLPAWHGGERGGAPEAAAPLGDRDLWPDLFRGVAEATPPDLGRLLRAFGGIGFLALGVLGAALLARDAARRCESARSAAPEVIVLLWLAGTCALATEASRHLFLAGPPFAIALGTAIGRAASAAAAWLRSHSPAVRAVGGAIFAVTLLAVVASPIVRGSAIASSYLPMMNDAWFGTLAAIRDRTARDAIVLASWEFGYWVKFVAERRTGADGASLRTHVPAWLDRAQAAPDEAESAGILRMLACGSDATPYPEGRLGAYGKLRAATGDPLAAARLLRELVRLDEAGAAERLADRGLSDEQAADVLRSSHCRPPETLWILSTRQRGSEEQWMRTGSWDFDRALVLHRARHGPMPSAIADLGRRLGLAPAAAEARLAEAARLGVDFVVPRETIAWRFAPVRAAAAGWSSCVPAPHGGTVCPAALENVDDGTVLHAVFHDPASPERTTLLLHREGPGVSETLGAVPGVVLIAAPEGILTVVPSKPTRPEIGVLVDPAGPRVLIGTPAFLHSTFTHLVHLGGRYATRFEKVDERVGLTGERVQIWRLRDRPVPAGSAADAGR